MKPMGWFIAGAVLGIAGAWVVTKSQKASGDNPPGPPMWEMGQKLPDGTLIVKVSWNAGMGIYWYWVAYPEAPSIIQGPLTEQGVRTATEAKRFAR